MRRGHRPVEVAPGAGTAGPQASGFQGCGFEKRDRVFGMKRSLVMDCDRFRGDLVELARGESENDALRAHLSSCAGCQREFDAQVRLSKIVSVLSAQAAAAIPSLEPGAMLLAEFDAAA